MPTDSLIIDVPVSFTCPICDRRSTYKLMYAGSKVSASTACRCRKCDNTVVLSYHIKKTQKGQYKLKVLSCRSKEVWYRNKRYQLTKIPQ